MRWKQSSREVLPHASASSRKISLCPYFFHSAGKGLQVSREAAFFRFLARSVEPQQV
jgi:hypothetical protein